MYHSTSYGRRRVIKGGISSIGETLVVKKCISKLGKPSDQKTYNRFSDSYFLSELLVFYFYRPSMFPWHCNDVWKNEIDFLSNTGDDRLLGGPRESENNRRWISPSNKKRWRDYCKSFIKNKTLLEKSLFLFYVNCVGVLVVHRLNGKSKLLLQQKFGFGSRSGEFLF